MVSQNLPHRCRSCLFLCTTSVAYFAAELLSNHHPLCFSVLSLHLAKSCQVRIEYDRIRTFFEFVAHIHPPIYCSRTPKFVPDPGPRYSSLAITRPVVSIHPYIQVLPKQRLKEVYTQTYLSPLPSHSLLPFAQTYLLLPRLLTLSLNLSLKPPIHSGTLTLNFALPSTTAFTILITLNAPDPSALKSATLATLQRINFK